MINDKAQFQIKNPETALRIFTKSILTMNLMNQMRSGLLTCAAAVSKDIKAHL